MFEPEDENQDVTAYQELLVRLDRSETLAALNEAAARVYNEEQSFEQNDLAMQTQSSHEIGHPR